MFYIDDTLDEIKQKASKQGYHLDMSLESLKDLAQFVRENDVKNDPENIDDFFNSWVYLGEVFRIQAKGAYWTVGTENPKNLNYGLEYLTGYNTIGSEFIPLLIMNNFTLSSPNRLNNNFFYLNSFSRGINSSSNILRHAHFISCVYLNGFASGCLALYPS